MPTRIFLVIAVLLAILSTGCRAKVLKIGAQSGTPYFDAEKRSGTGFEKIADRVYTFHWKWYRNIAIDTDEGWVVIDPFNPVAAKSEAEFLQKTKPGHPVRMLIYSHYHLDHTGGGAALAPKEVVAHEYCQKYWDDAKKLGNAGAANVLAPTRTITGDQTLTIGGVEIRLMDMGRSHSEHLYAFHLPAQRLLFTADNGLVKTVPPLGIPDSYFPGVIAGLDRLAAIDFDLFVPSHFDMGKKQDLIDYRDYLLYQRQLVREAGAKIGHVNDKKTVGQLFDYVYPKMKERYGHWHGFNEMFLFGLFREGTGELLGY